MKLITVSDIFSLASCGCMDVVLNIKATSILTCFFLLFMKLLDFCGVR